MVYLIGGPPRCGKSTVARLLARRTGASWLLLDNLEQVVCHYLPAGERSTALPAFAEAGSNERYAAHSTAEIVAILRTCARTLWPAVHVLIHCALEQDQDLILDGYQIEPHYLSQFTTEHEPPDATCQTLTEYQAAMVQRGTGYALAHAGDPRVRAVFLCRHDPADIQAGFARATDANDWILGQDNWPVTLQRIAAMISHYSGIIRQQAEADGATFISMDYTFESQVEHAVAHLTAPAGL
jgi:hypothetical protein